MSSLLAGDGWMHYHDGSHRWPGPDEEGHTARREQVVRHQQEHRRRFGDAPAARSVRDAVRGALGAVGW